MAICEYLEDLFPSPNLFGDRLGSAEHVKPIESLSLDCY